MAGIIWQLQKANKNAFVAAVSLPDCLPDYVMQAGVIQAGLPDCIIQASIPLI